MACWALTHRFINTWWIWVGSASTGCTVWVTRFKRMVLGSTKRSKTMASFTTGCNWQAWRWGEAP